MAVMVALASGAAATLAAAGEQVVKESDVPKVVRAAVAAAYPKAHAARFEKDDEGGNVAYEVLLEADGARWELVVAPDGKVLEEERKIELSEAPEAVRKSLAASKYATAKVTGVEKITKAGQPNTPVFEIAVVQGSDKHELVFTHTGELTKDEKVGKKD
jgi:hypothetical protein